MNVETILRNKGSWVATIRPDASIAEAIEMLNRRAHRRACRQRGWRQCRWRAVRARHRDRARR